MTPNDEHQTEPDQTDPGPAHQTDSGLLIHRPQMQWPQMQWPRIGKRMRPRM